MLLDITNELNTEISTLDRLLSNLFDHAVTFGLKLIAAVIIFFIGRWAIKWIRKFTTRFFEKRKVESTVRSFLDSLINITLQIVLFLIIVNILGISTTSFAAILAAAGLAVGMAMKDNLSNFAGGVMLLINKPFKVGNYIIAQGTEGSVQSIGILYTVLLTGDNRTVFLPNGPLSTGAITNNSTQLDRRVDITLNLNSGTDIEAAKSALDSIIKSDTRIKEYPIPFIGVTALNNGTLDITIRAWVKSGEYGDVNVSLNEKIYSTFIQNDLYASSSLNIKMLKD
ncbi:MAG: mechanosensitive ion channel family protein [Dysgonomonas sp.]|nr:mechanosensitive ion channel family protein [Dysgonomonas sp.]